MTPGRPIAFFCSLPIMLAACDRGPSPSADWSDVAAESLASKANCTACHAAPAASIDRLRPMGAPTMDDIGTRAYRPWMAEFIAKGTHVGQLGSRMPDLMHGLDKESRERIAVAIAAWLSTRGQFASESLSVGEGSLARGKRLYETVGCLACHGEGLDAVQLARKTSLEALTGFLEDPLKARPSGHMPGMLLSRNEARDIASWLLRAQSGSLDVPIISEGNGLDAEYFEGAFDGIGPAEDAVPLRRYRAERIELPKDARQDNFALRYSGAIEIPQSGMWTFHLGSDDGSALWIDGNLLIDHGGIHGGSYKTGRIKLSQGTHDIKVQYFESAGDAALKLQWNGPGTPRGDVPPTAFSTRVVRFTPGPAIERPDEALLTVGKSKWAALGCANCHEPAIATLKAKPLAELDAEAGCLANEVPAAAPQYGFDDAQRSLLRTLVVNHSALERPLPPKQAIVHTMDRMNCVACHSRDGLGGVGPDRDALFTCDVDLGDEGRIPPSLTGVGAKLQTAAIERMLSGTERVRPYMNTRMPAYGSGNVSHLAAHFTAADPAVGADSQPAYSEEAIEAGKTIVGTSGASCVNCHTLGDQKSLGVPAVNLASMHGRVRPSWFRAYLADPQRFRPGTRMPAFWPPDQRVYPEIAGGDRAKQIDGVWTYLSLGGSMPLPKGLAIAPGQYDLEPDGRTVVFGTFMEGIGARCHAIGFPERVSAVYDAGGLRLAQAWKGKFMNAEGTWNGRAGELSLPAGTSVIDLASEPVVAILGSPSDPWPDSVKSGLRFLGMQRDARGNPTFSIGRDGLRMDEAVGSVLFTGGARLTRTFTVHARSTDDSISLRLAEGSSIVAEGEGWRIDDGPVIFVSGARPLVRTVDGRAELMAGVPLKPSSDPSLPYSATVRTELAW
jgi:mono/diheme cytochrome c family protein